jgi:hypothetical protein
LYRWSLEQMLVNDSPDLGDLPARARLGWALARLFSVVWLLEFHAFGQSQATLHKPWHDRRSELRRLLREARFSRGPLAGALDTAWSPLLISRVTSFFFWIKILLLIGCYALLGAYLLP